MKIMKAAPKVPPFRPEIERLFDRFFASPLQLFGETPVLETEWSPSLDYSETDNEYVVRIEAPGMHRENLDVGVEGNILTLTGKREFVKEEEGEEFIWRERQEGRFVRSLRLPKAVDPEKVMAAYQDGVLTVHLPKVEPAKKSRIAIK